MTFAGHEDQLRSIAAIDVSSILLIDIHPASRGEVRPFYLFEGTGTFSQGVFEGPLWRRHFGKLTDSNVSGADLGSGFRQCEHAQVAVLNSNDWQR